MDAGFDGGTVDNGGRECDIGAACAGVDGDVDVVDVDDDDVDDVDDSAFDACVVGAVSERFNAA